MRYRSETVPQQGTQLILLALDGIDWDFMQQLAAQGLMHYMSTLIDAGSWASLSFPPPNHPESDWISLATGVLADKHGILHPIEKIAGSIFLQAPTAHSLKRKSLWHITDEAKLKTAVVGWPATLGLNLDHGWVIAAGSEQSSGSMKQVWPLHPDAVHPLSFRNTFSEMRLHPEEIHFQNLDYFLEALSHTSRKSLADNFARILAELSTLHAVTSHLTDDEHAEIVCVRFEFITRVTQLLNQIPEDSGKITTLGRCYQFIDLICGRYMNLAGKGANYALVSNGTRHLPAVLKEIKTSDLFKPNNGFIVLNGHNIHPDSIIPPVTAVDILPTLTHLLNLQSDSTCDGLLIPDFFVSPPTPAFFAGEDTTAAIQNSDAISENTEMLAFDPSLLKNEGIPTPDFSRFTQISQRIECETLFAYAQVSLFRGITTPALKILRTLSARFPAFFPAQILLAEQLLRINQFTECELIVNQLPLVKEGEIWNDIAKGLIAFAKQNWPEAQSRFISISQIKNAPLNPHTWLGKIYLHQELWSEALDSFKTASTFDSHDADAWAGLGTVYFQLQEYSNAAQALGHAVSLNVNSAELLLKLSQSWDKCGQSILSSQTLLRALRLAPDLVARELMAQQAQSSAHKKGFTGEKSK